MAGAVVGDFDMAESRSWTPVESARSRDWVRQPVGCIFWWIMPISLGMSTNFWHLPLAKTALLWAIALAWMGTGCALNALRCGRRHCLISGPVLCLGAIATLFVALGFLSGRNAMGAIVNGTIALAALSFLSEWFWGLYAGRK